MKMPSSVGDVLVAATLRCPAARWEGQVLLDRGPGVLTWDVSRVLEDV